MFTRWWGHRDIHSHRSRSRACSCTCVRRYTQPAAPEAQEGPPGDRATVWTELLRGSDACGSPGVTATRELRAQPSRGPGSFHPLRCGRNRCSRQASETHGHRVGTVTPRWTGRRPVFREEWGRATLLGQRTFPYVPVTGHPGPCQKGTFVAQAGGPRVGGLCRWEPGIRVRRIFTECGFDVLWLRPG